jgi:hypothetical protein
MAVGINIVTGFDGGGLEKAIKEFNKLQTTADKTKFVIQKAALPAAAALAGIAAAAGLATKAAMQDAEEQAKLAQTLRQATGATNEQIAAVEKQVSAFMKVSTFTDGELRPALASLVQATGDVARSQELMSLAMDISVATGTPLIAVTDALAKAENGQMRALAMLAPAVRENVKEGASLGEVYTKLGEVFGGAALAQTKTAAGQMQQFRNQVGELAESFGSILLPVVQAILPVMSSLASFAERNRGVIVALTAVIAAFATAILLATGYIKLMNLQQRLMEVQAYKNATAMLTSAKAVNAYGMAAKTAGGALAVAALAQTIFEIGNAASGADRKIDEASKGIIISLGSLRGASKEDTTQVIGDFVKLAQEIDSKLKMGDVFGDFGREFQLTIDGAKVDIEDFDEAFKRVMETSPEQAAKLVGALKAQLAVTDPTSQAYKDLADAIARYESQVNLAKGATDALNTGIGSTISLAQVARQAFLNVQQAKYDDMRMSNAGKDALKKYHNELGIATKSLGANAKAVKTVKELNDSYRSAVEGLVGAQQSLKDASQGVADAQQKVKDAAHGVTQAERAQKKAADDVAEAIKGIAKAQAATAAARKTYQDNVAATAKAQEKLKKATESVAVAQEAFNAAVRGYGAASKQGKDASRQLADAQQASEQSAYDIESAQFAVIDAESELAAVRADATATPRMIREAEIALAEAKLALVDAQEKQTDTQDGLTQALDHYDQMLNGVREGSTIYKDLLDDLNAAKAAEQEAIEGVNTAREREVEALSAIQDALDGEADAAKRVEDAKWALAEAERDVAAAKRDQATAIGDVAKAQLDEALSLYEVAKAQREVNAARKNAPAAGVGRIDAEFEAIRRQLEAAGASTSTANATAASEPIYDFTGLGGLMMFARGGIVTAPTLGIVGEAGPEAVIPLDRAGAMGTTINVTVNAGMGTNGDAVGKAVVDALRQYQRHNGAIPITVA